MDVDEFREQSRKTWDAMAAGWEARDAFLERNMGLVNDWSAPGPFALADPEQIRALLTRAGFSEPEIVAIDFAFHYADPDDAWNAIIDLNGPLAVIINAPTTDEQAATRAAVLHSFAAYRQADGSYPVPAQAWGVLAR